MLEHIRLVKVLIWAVFLSAANAAPCENWLWGIEGLSRVPWTGVGVGGAAVVD